MLDKIESGEYDSAHTVYEIYGRCWFNGKPLNCDPVRHTHSGEIVPVVVEAGDCKIFPSKLQTISGRRIGTNPYRHPVSIQEGWDIDNENDFRFAEILAKHWFNSKERLDV